MAEPNSKIAAFLSELKRRRVFRVAMVYAGVAFIIIQIIDGAFEPKRFRLQYSKPYESKGDSA